MYASIWRMLPGPWWVRALISLALFAAIAFVLFQWVFPVIAPWMPFYESDVSIG